MRKILMSLFLIMISLYSCRKTPGEKLAEVLINDVALVDGELPFQPGSINIVKILPDWKLIFASELNCIIKKTLPDGKTEVFNKTIGNGDDAEIILGLMTAPPLYEFRARDVYRTGYGIEIILKRKVAIRELLHISLNQGLSDIAKPSGAGDFRNIKTGKERLIADNRRSVLYNPMYGVKAAMGMRLHESVLDDQNNIRDDPAEKKNIYAANLNKVKELQELLTGFILNGRSIPGKPQLNDPYDKHWWQINFIR